MEADLSLWGLFAQAGLFVKTIMLLLIALSVVSWTLIFQRVKALKYAQQLHKQFEEQFWSGVDLNKLYEHLNARPRLLNGLAAIFHAGFKEFLRSEPHSVSPEALTKACHRAMQVAISKEEDKLDAHLAFLATVSSYCPYIGLLGTVWGIMNSFMALGSVQQATLSMVAPGIAEALIATALGLVAAIPAALAYNRFSHVSGRLSRQYENFSDEMMSILQRQAFSKGSKGN